MKNKIIYPSVDFIKKFHIHYTSNFLSTFLDPRNYIDTFTPYHFFAFTQKLDNNIYTMHPLSFPTTRLTNIGAESIYIIKRKSALLNDEGKNEIKDFKDFSKVNELVPYFEDMTSLQGSLNKYSFDFYRMYKNIQPNPMSGKYCITLNIRKNVVYKKINNNDLEKIEDQLQIIYKKYIVSLEQTHSDFHISLALRDLYKEGKLQTFKTSKNKMNEIDNILNDLGV